MLFFVPAVLDRTETTVVAAPYVAVMNGRHRH